MGGALQKVLGTPEILLQVLRKASAEQRDTRVPAASIQGWRGRCRALASSGSGDGAAGISSCPLEPRQHKCRKLNYRKAMEATALVSSFGQTGDSCVHVVGASGLRHSLLRRRGSWADVAPLNHLHFSLTSFIKSLVSCRLHHIGCFSASLQQDTFLLVL